MAFPRTVSARRILSRVGLAASVLVLAFIAPGCEKIALLAPSGSAITFAAATSALITDEVPVGVLVLEAKATTPPPQQGGNNNQTPATGGGTPVHDGTLVTFTSTSGQVAPPEARTVNGRLVVTFIPSGLGKVTITAKSGTAQSTHEIDIKEPPTGGGSQQ